MRRTVSDLKQSSMGGFDAVEHYIGMTNAKNILSSQGGLTRSDRSDIVESPRPVIHSPP